MKSNPKITFWINNIKPDTTEIFKIFMRLIFITKLRSTEYFILNTNISRMVILGLDLFSNQNVTTVKF